jgi:aspartate racemase
VKKIGIIGGLSWESTIEYYRIINQETNKILGDLHSAKIIMYSYDFALIEELQRHEQWDKIAIILIDVAQKLINAGAEVIVIATNTLHKLVPQIEREIPVPIFHIADATAREILKQKFNKILLLGTKYTMQEDFYKGKLQNEYGIEVLTPSQWEQKLIHTIIFDELCKGIKSEEAKNAILNIIDKAKAQGADAVVLGCTELPNLIKEASLPILNTAQIHSVGIVQYALSPTFSVEKVGKKTLDTSAFR